MYTCIIAEDEKQIRNGLFNYFNWAETGFDPLGAARNGQEALKLIEKHNPHLVITDINMPVMNGLKLMEHALKINKNIKFIVLSGYDDFEYAKKSIEYGVIDYILKPLNIQEFKNTLKQVYAKIQEEDDRNLLFKRGISLLKHDFLKNIAKGSISGNVFIKRKAHELGIDTNSNIFYVMCIAVEDDVAYTVDNKKDLSIKKNIVSNLVGEIMDRYGESCIFNDDENQIIAIFYIDEKKKKVASNILNEITEEINNYFNHKTYIGLSGEFSDIYRISDLYDKSNLNLQHEILKKDLDKNDQGKIVNNAILAIKTSDLKDVSLEYIAKQIYVSPYYLSRIFKQETGENFINYVTKIRVEKAKELILNFNLDTNQIADIIGYNSTKYFLKVFKKYTDLTPREFKKVSLKS